MDEKVLNPMVQQMEAHAAYLKEFLPRFFDHIDPESGPVKGIHHPQMTANKNSRCCRNRIQSDFLELCRSFGFVSTCAN
jgi:hypothetical protein